MFDCTRHSDLIYISSISTICDKSSMMEAVIWHKKGVVTFLNQGKYRTFKLKDASFLTHGALLMRLNGCLNYDSYIIYAFATCCIAMQNYLPFPFYPDNKKKYWPTSEHIHVKLLEVRVQRAPGGSSSQISVGYLIQWTETNAYDWLAA